MSPEFHELFMNQSSRNYYCFYNAYLAVIKYCISLRKISNLEYSKKHCRISQDAKRTKSETRTHRLNSEIPGDASVLIRIIENARIGEIPVK